MSLSKRDFSLVIGTAGACLAGVFVLISILQSNGSPKSRSSTVQTLDASSDEQIVAKWIAQNANDADGLEFVQWGPHGVIAKGTPGERHIIRVRYRSKNLVGAKQLSDSLFYVKNGLVAGVHENLYGDKYPWSLAEDKPADDVAEAVKRAFTDLKKAIASGDDMALWEMCTENTRSDYDKYAKFARSKKSNTEGTGRFATRFAGDIQQQWRSEVATTLGITADAVENLTGQEMFAIEGRRVWNQIPDSSIIDRIVTKSPDMAITYLISSSGEPIADRSNMTFHFENRKWRIKLRPAFPEKRLPRLD